MLLAAVSCRAWSLVDITGVEGAILENVSEYLPDRPACDAERETVTRYAEDLPERLRPALDAFGYYSADITATLQPPAEDCWRVQVEIDAGPQVLVRDTSVQLRGSAEDDPTMQTLFANFPLAPGDPLLHARYRTFKDGVDVLARQRGYLDGAFAAQRIDVFVDEQAADITLVYESGPRYRFGDVTFETDALADDVLESFLPFEEGAPFDASLVGRLQRELTASRYFAQTTVVTDIRAAADGRIPIRVDAVPSEPRSYTVGGGYSTDDGPRIRFSYDNDRRNRRGHQLRADATLAEVRQTAAVEYRVPVGNPQRDWRSYRVGLAREDFVAGISSAARFSVHRTQAGELVTTTRFVDALFERDEIGGTYSFSNSMLVPGISWLRNYRDDLARPREGHRLSLVLSAGVGSEVSLLRADFRGKWITALPWDARVLLRGRLGAMVEDGPFGFVPLSMRFFAGGDNSVRGYDYQSLGPRDQFDDLIGGNRLIEASVEYEHPVLDDWSVAAFVDSGNAFLDSGFDTQTGAGIGARWFSPLGPVRLDIAWPLHGPDRSAEIHLSLGPDL